MKDVVKVSRVMTIAIAGAMALSALGESELPKNIFSETPAEKTQRLAWWTHDRFGMFIHFGLYSVPGRHEWIRNKESIDNETWDSTYLPRFDPDLLNVRDWVKAAKSAGMKYIVLTAKHHEGFCNWDTQTTDYKITKTAYGKDLLKEYVEACRAEGIKVGVYFSIIDWHHPQFTIDSTHPLRPKLDPGVFHEQNGAANAPDEYRKREYARLNQGRDMAKYREYMFAQVKEILTQYGRIDILWFDYCQQGKFGKTWKDYDSVNLLKFARSLQPWIIVDNRLGLGETDDGWDFATPEQFKVAKWPEVRGKRVPWETCQTFSGSWGYYRDETSWKSPAQLIEILIHAVSFGGNLIMNVGPTGRGCFDERAEERLAAYAKWMKFNSRSIYGCTMAPEEFKAPNGTLLTYNPEKKRLYIHLLNYPMDRLPVTFGEKIAYVQLLHDGSELKVGKLPAWQQTPGGGDSVAINLPVQKPNDLIPVLEVFLK